jgi:ribonuclease BN (tRNA processing enzyme)
MGIISITKKDLKVRDLDTQEMTLEIKIISKKLIATQEMIKVKRLIQEVEEEEDLEEIEAIEVEIDLKMKGIDLKEDHREVETAMEDLIPLDLIMMVKDLQEAVEVKEVKEVQAEDLQEVTPKID